MIIIGLFLQNISKHSNKYYTSVDVLRVFCYYQNNNKQKLHLKLCNILTKNVLNINLNF